MRAAHYLLIVAALAVPIHFLSGGTDPPDWHRPFTPFKIVGNIYYVGTADLASYLVRTPAGNILINTDFEKDVPLIEKSIVQLGFRVAETKIILVSHAHSDHVSGTALIKGETSAKLMVMAGDVAAMENGTADYRNSDQHWAPVKVDRVLHDEDSVELGDTTLIAHLTAGHTKGCTTWTTQVQDSGRSLSVLIDCSLNLFPDYKLVGDPNYPGIAKDFENTFRLDESLPCDVFLSAHASIFNMQKKYRRLKADGGNPFVDPSGCRSYILAHDKSFQDELKRQEHQTKR